MRAFWFLVVCSAACFCFVCMLLSLVCCARCDVLAQISVCVYVHTHVVKPCVSVCCVVHIAPAQISEYLLPFLPRPSANQQRYEHAGGFHIAGTDSGREIVVHQGGELQWRNTTWGGRVEVQCSCFSGVCIEVVCSNLCWLHCEHFTFVAVWRLCSYGRGKCISAHFVHCA